MQFSRQVRPLVFLFTGGLTAAIAGSGVEIAAPTNGNAESHAASQKSQWAWSPPNVDAPLPSIESSAPCSLAELLEQAGQRAQELVNNLQSFTARETVDYEQLDDFGAPTEGNRALFEYAVGFDEYDGRLKVTEARTPAAGTDSLPKQFQDSGLPAIALIFHPYYQGDFQMRCEGAAEKDGEKAWVIHFEQRKDKRSRIRSFHTAQGSYPARLKGRAWVSAASRQVLEIETNLMSPLLMIHLRSDAVRVDYAPVQFTSKNLTLWLPKSSESYGDFEKYRIVVKRTFSDYLLSSVQTQQMIGAPKN